MKEFKPKSGKGRKAATRANKNVDIDFNALDDRSSGDDGKVPDDDAFNAHEEKKQRAPKGEKKAPKVKKPKKEAAPVNLNSLKVSNRLLG